MALRIPRGEMAKIRDHARAAYPEECCGFLVGPASDPRAVSEARAARNVAKEDRGRRYEIDPLDVLRLEDELRKKGLRNLGFYHSHPDHPARPSEFDRTRAAWEGMAYLIVSVEAGKPVDARLWIVEEGVPDGAPAETARAFREGEIEVV